MDQNTKLKSSSNNTHYTMVEKNNSCDENQKDEEVTAEEDVIVKPENSKRKNKKDRRADDSDSEQLTQTPKDKPVRRTVGKLGAPRAPTKNKPTSKPQEERRTNASIAKRKLDFGGEEDEDEEEAKRKRLEHYIIYELVPTLTPAQRKTFVQRVWAKVRQED